VGARLGLDANTSAVGVAEVVDENMANAARAHAVENGKDMGGYTMIAFGGGAPLHAARLMDKLGLEELIVPPGAGVGSAIGFLVAPFSYEAVRSFYTSTLDFDVDGSNDVLASLTDEAMSFVRPALAEDAEAILTVERQVSMRYAGQGWEIPVALDDDSTFDEFAAELLSAKFTKAYEEFFGRAIDDLAIETVSWSVRVSSIVPAGERVELSIASSSVVAPVAYRNELLPGTRLHGPAIIAEAQTTTVLASHHTCTVQADGTLLITRDRSEQ
jgi:N-methylhydantoinase A